MKQRHLILGVNSRGVAKCICGRNFINGEADPDCPASQVARFEDLTLLCETCTGLGWIVVGQTLDWPYGEQVQCPDCQSIPESES